MNHATRHRLGILLRVLLVAGCLGYAFWNVDLGGLAGALAGIDPLRVVAALLLSGVSYLLLAVRLRVLTHGRAGIASGLAATLLCLGLNNLMPARLGEVAKAVYLQRRHAMQLSEAALVVGWERFFDVNLLVLLALASAYPYLQDTLLLPLAGGLLLAWAGTWAVIRYPGPVRELIRRLPWPRVSRFLHEVHAHLDTRCVRGTLLGTALLSALLWTAHALVSMLVLLWVCQLPLAPEQALVVFIVGATGMAVPSSPGALG
ncbi:MAG TPA: lysylphosphatidylglycerol synthase transmembrane domain-containing protein, partial [Gammaproteobacteria bacterium]